MAAGGPNAVTLRSLADELGGSITLVTHYFPNRSAIFEAIQELLLMEGVRELAEISEDLSQTDRLRAFLEWLLPTTIESLELERIRVAMVTEADPSLNLRQMVDRWEREMREAISRFVAPLVGRSALPFYVDLVRVVHNGVALSAVEHPDYWTRERQLAFIDAVVPLIEHTGSALTPRQS